MQTKKHNLIMLILMTVVILLTFVSASLVATTLAKYMSSKTDNNSSVVAKFNVSEALENGGAEQVLTVKLKPGESVTERVLVTNSGDVLIKYTITVINSTNNLPLEFIGYTGTIAPGQADFVCPITITWPKEKNDPSFSGKVDMIKISIQVEQVVEGS